MSRSAVNRVLWEVARDRDAAKSLVDDPEAFLARRDLDDDERADLAGQDIRALFGRGVHPFLLYNFALRLSGGFSIPFMQGYLGRIEGLRTGDVET